MKKLLYTLLLLTLCLNLYACGEEESGEEIWEYEVGSPIYSSPSIEGNKLVVTSLDGKVTCLDLDGNVLWQYEASGSVFASPLIDGDRVIIGSSEGKVLCLAIENGNKIWEREISYPIISSPALYQDKLFLAGTDGTLYALNLNGEFIWSKNIEGSIYATPAIEKGNLIIGSTTGRVFSINASSGSTSWSEDIDDPIELGTCIDDTNQAYIATTSGKLHCFDIDDGTKLWEVSFRERIIGSPTYYKDTVFISLSDGTVYALSSSGRILWSYKAEGVLTTAVCLTDGYAYFGDSKANLYCLRASDGKEVWISTLDSPVSSEPVATKDKLFVGTRNGKLYCIKAASSESKWPTFRGNKSRTGREPE